MTSFLQSSHTNDSFADAISALLMLVKGELKEGGNYWAYIAIKPEMLASFNSVRSNGMFDLEEYGTILDWGKGEQPPAMIKAQMQATYGVSDSDQAIIAQKIKELS